MFELFLVALWATLAVCAGIVAQRKNRDVFGWVVLTVLFAPLILILLALGPKTTARREQEAKRSQPAKPSPPASRLVERGDRRFMVPKDWSDDEIDRYLTTH